MRNERKSIIEFQVKQIGLINWKIVFNLRSFSQISIKNLALFARNYTFYLEKIITKKSNVSTGSYPIASAWNKIQLSARLLFSGFLNFKVRALTFKIKIYTFIQKSYLTLKLIRRLFVGSIITLRDFQITFSIFKWEIFIQWSSIYRVISLNFVFL